MKINTILKKNDEYQDIVLIGAGIMSSTLGILLKELMPEATLSIFERLDSVAAESSDAWNNAGTGHSAFCELNYTPQREDGSIDISKALKIAGSFEESRQFWAYLVKNNRISASRSFIRHIPHISFVWGEENVHFLQQRYELLRTYELFGDMLYTEDRSTMANWMPLMMEGRDTSQQVAATKMDIGTDVNFGALTRSMIRSLETLKGVSVYLGHEIREINKQADGHWEVEVKNLATKNKRKLRASFVFIGAGGGTQSLLEKTNIPEAAGYGGFPISGQWLKCTNEAVINRHHAKVYGKAAVGAPPMSVPHLDTRLINGKKELLFGPYAGFSTKFLKNGSYFDLPLSLELHNIYPILAAGARNIPLTKYLIEQVIQSPEDRLSALRAYVPEARMEDWELAIAGQRVQVIKKNKEAGGVLEFGTEIVTAADGTLAALLGASPGASTAVSIMTEVLKKCFPDGMRSEKWQEKLTEIIPSYGFSLAENGKMCTQIRNRNRKILNIQ